MLAAVEQGSQQRCERRHLVTQQCSVEGRRRHQPITAQVSTYRKGCAHLLVDTGWGSPTKRMNQGRQCLVIAGGEPLQERITHETIVQERDELSHLSVRKL